MSENKSFHPVIGFAVLSALFAGIAFSQDRGEPELRHFWPPTWTGQPSENTGPTYFWPPSWKGTAPQGHTDTGFWPRHNPLG